MFYENQTMKEVLQDKTIETVKDLLFPPNFFDWIYEDKIEENYHSRRAYIYAVAVLYRGGVCILRNKGRE